MIPKIDSLERTLLELGSELYRIKHRMDEVDRSNQTFRQIFVSLRKLLDDKGMISSDEFEETVDLDKILNLEAANKSYEPSSSLADDLKKVVN